MIPEIGQVALILALMTALVLGIESNGKRD